MTELETPAPTRRSAADKPMTRRGCLLGVGVWLAVMLLPICALIFAIRGEVSWRRGPLVEDRLWLVNLAGGPGEESAAGLAYSATRLTDRPNAAAGTQCTRTRVYFLLWRGHSDPLDYCECYQSRAAPLTGYDSLGTCT